MEKEDLASWFDNYGETILTYILLMVRDYQQAEDLTQETFMKAYRNKQSFSRQSSIKTWLFSIAHNTTIDYLRKKHPLQHFLGLTTKEIDHQALPEQVVALSIQNEELYQAVQKLKHTYRQVILLRKIKEFSTQETAEILNWSESKVKMTLKRALSDLKSELIKGGYEYEGSVE
ncbi:RNA polymerase subunit sigma-24 [Lysinibacillus contaminans]|uniref:RNA polymerase sigma factor n=1 Tax=Lysinibacillus contaminans TaxID=1293441 RepID=A0ABR5K1Q5_9BACI|nr:RNA polymerase sigma factor [Lysinibacillus contaminans]KOS68867.1 RNA polymerase subunit sigma-24 [Lysinibacillus contaminans]